MRSSKSSLKHTNLALCWLALNPLTRTIDKELHPGQVWLMTFTGQASYGNWAAECEVFLGQTVPAPRAARAGFTPGLTFRLRSRSRCALAELQSRRTSVGSVRGGYPHR